MSHSSGSGLEKQYHCRQNLLGLPVLSHSYGSSVQASSIHYQQLQQLTHLVMLVKASCMALVSHNGMHTAPYFKALVQPPGPILASAAVLAWMTASDDVL